MNTKPLLSVENLNISFAQKAGAFTAVSNLSFELHTGKVLAIVGESGSGKSLTALALMGLLPHSAAYNGNIALEDFQLNHIAAKEWQTIRGKKVGMIFQEPMSSLNPVMTIGKQLQETILAHQNISKSEAKKAAIEWLGKVQLPDPAKAYYRYPHEMSGGQKQRVMIAMAMCNHPILLIADEPTTALDVTVQQDVISLMKSLQLETGTAMIFITHDLGLASMIADSVLVMYNGNAVEYGPVEQIFHSPKHSYTKALIACKPSVEDKNKRLLTVSDFMSADGNMELKREERMHKVPADDKLLEINNLKVWFTEETNWIGRPLSHFKAVNNVSFVLNRGEVLGLVGESGCGKSTLGKSIMGLLPANQGEIFYEGDDITKYDAAQKRKLSREIQMIFQDPYSSLNPRLNIGELITEPMRVHGIVPNAELQEEARRLLDIVQLPADSFKRYPHQFSGGQRQRIGIARALSLRPHLLICDESVSALDVSVQAQILNLLKDLQQVFDLTYLFISHDLSVVHYMSDRVIVMQSGEIVESGPASEVLQHPKNAYTQRLIQAMPEIR